MRHPEEFAIIRTHYNKHFLAQRLQGIQEAFIQSITASISHCLPTSPSELKSITAACKDMATIGLALEAGGNADPEQQADLKSIEATLNRLSAGE